MVSGLLTMVKVGRF